MPISGDIESGSFGEMHVPGLYVALLTREKNRCEQIDPRSRPRFNPNSLGGRTAVETGVRSTAMLDALMAGHPVTAQGRDLRGRSMPDVPLQRDQAFDCFRVRPDDTLTHLQ
ncbi:hypothetical protein [Mycolicibacterium sp. 120270]|uniref:hypothetical protein n=1 Tax=Mycolicibacterium sp. 120270 TaxID=3090600 RepID=UPI00299E21FF|nr:hypothetical protein [Mycolicibacterium sp. 120270]MDX1883043.1 hypothetical protein [Mycolicibacterium sp. 120270]